MSAREGRRFMGCNRLRALGVIVPFSFVVFRLHGVGVMSRLSASSGSSWDRGNKTTWMTKHLVID